MRYQKQKKLFGKWVKTSELANGSGAKIVSETNSQQSQFQNKDGSVKIQDVCRVQFEGIPEPLNVSLNRATINGLVDAFGEESVNWQGHNLKVETEKMRVAGRAVVALYLIPDGYKKIDDDNGYANIVKINSNYNPEMIKQDRLQNPQYENQNQEEDNQEMPF